MVARRLLVVLLILLGISTLLYVIAVPERSGDSETTTAPTEPVEPTPPAELPERGRLLKATIDADAGKLEVVPLRAGDEIQLFVRSKRLDQVEIPKLGLIEAVSPDAPASFDILASEPGAYKLRLVEADRLAGRLEVSEARRERSPQKGTGPRGRR